jgi:hypothetical protein
MGETLIQRLGDDLLAASSETDEWASRGRNDPLAGRAWMSESFTGARERPGSRELSADESAKPARPGRLV